MKMPIQFDTLDYAKKLEAAGVPAVQAEAHASALGEVLGKSIVVHAELLAMEQRLDARLDASDETRNQMFAASDEKMQHMFAVSDEKTNHKFEAFEQKFDARFEKLELKFNSEMNTMRWMIGTLIFLVGGVLLRQLQG